MKCFVPAALALAATTVVAADEPVQLSPVQVTATRQSEGVFEAPQALTVLTAEDLAELNPQVMAQAFRDQPGAYFQQTGPGQGIVISRGLKGAEVLHLVDGMRLNNAFFRTAPSQYIALLDPYNISQLELLRGPYATLYGSDAMGGVVQVLTPEVRFDGDKPGIKGGARFNYNSQDLSTNARVWAATGYRNFSFSAGVTTLDVESRKLAEPGQSTDHVGGFTLAERVEDTAYTGRGFDLKALMQLAPADELMVSVQSFELPKLPRYNETVPGFDTDGTPGAAVAVSIYDNSRRFYHLRYRHEAPLAFMDRYELHLAHQVIQDDRLDRTLSLSRDTFEYNRSALSGLTAHAETRVGAHLLRYGLEAYTDRVDSRSVRETPPGSGNFTFNSASGFQSRFPDGSRADDYGLYLFDEWTLAERWRLDGGLRYSHHKTHIAQADRAFGAEISDDDLTGNLGLRFAVTPALAWSTNIGRGYRVPNIENLAQVGRRANSRVIVANLNLRPESILSIDTGLKFAGERLSGEATLFYSDYKDRVSLVVGVIPQGTDGCPASETTPCSQNRNIAEATYYGFEGGLRWNLGSGFSTRAVLNYTWGQQESKGKKEPGNRVPPLNGQVSAEYRSAAGWSVEPYVQFAGRQDRLDASDRSDNRINPQGTAGFGTLNLRAQWALNERLSLQLDGYNLLDKAYREHASGIDGAAPGISLGARASFGG